MQAGYRTKPSARAKELKARIKNSKLDNAVYGSDFKAEAQLNAISDGPDSVKVVQPTPPSSTLSEYNARVAMAKEDPLKKKTLDQASPLGVDLTNLVYPSRSPSEASGSPVSISSTSSLRPVAPPRSDTSSTIRATTTNRANMFYLDEIRDRLAQGNFGLKPRATTQMTKTDVGQITRDGPQGNLRAEFDSIKGNSDSIKPSTLKTATKTAVETKLSNRPFHGLDAPNTQSQVQTDTVAASTAPAAAPIDSKSGLKATKSNLAEVMTKKDSNLSQTTTDPNSSTGSLPTEGKTDIAVDYKETSPYDDTILQAETQKMFDALHDYRISQKKATRDGKRQKSLSIQLYKWDSDGKSALAVKPNGKSEKASVQKSANGKYAFQFNGPHLSDQRVFDLRGSVAAATNRFNDMTFTPEWTATNKHLAGVGLEEPSARIVWKNSRPKKYDGTYDKYVLLPSFMNGNIRLYGTGDRSALLSQSNASPSFLRIVKDIVNNGTFDAKDYNSVADGEASKVNAFIKSTKPIIPSGVAFNASHAGDVYELRKRYQVLVGALSAGNHGSAVKDEMIDILRKLQRLKVMSVARVRNLIKGLNEL